MKAVFGKRWGGGVVLLCIPNFFFLSFLWLYVPRMYKGETLEALKHFSFTCIRIWMDRGVQYPGMGLGSFGISQYFLLHISPDSRYPFFVQNTGTALLFFFLFSPSFLDGRYYIFLFLLHEDHGAKCTYE